MYEKWVSWVGEDHILNLPDAKAVVDIVLGAIAITSGSRNWESYLHDLQERGQSNERINLVSNSLHIKK